MNQFYRALHMPPKRLLRKVMGEKEIYTIAVRPRPTAEGTEPLPALEGGPYTLLPGREGWWFADPLLYHRRGKRWLFAEAMDLSTGKGRLEVCELHDDGTADDWRVALEEDFHLSFPMVFDWNGEVWMIPETGSDHSLRLYRCKTFPTQWELVQRFPTDEELCDTILLDRRAEALTLLAARPAPTTSSMCATAATRCATPYRRPPPSRCLPRTRCPPRPARLSCCPMKPTICSTATLTLSAATPGRFSCWVSRSSTPPRSAPPWTTGSICSFLPAAAARRYLSAPPRRRTSRSPALPPRTSSASTPTAAMTF